MKTSHGTSTKSRGGGGGSSTISSRTRKTTTAAASRKRLRRLHRPPEDDEDDEEIEEEFNSPNSTSSAAAAVDEKRKTDEGGETNVDNSLCFIDFGGDNPDGNAISDSTPAIISLVCDRDLDQHSLQSDELDQLQFELEKSLAQVVINQRKLRLALKELTAAHGVGGQATASAARPTSSAASTFGGKSSSTSRRKFPKTQQIVKRPTSSGISSAAAGKRNRTLGNKDRRLVGHESMPSCSRSYYYAQQNHQMPDKFWLFVDQYAGNLTSLNDLESLKELIRESDYQSSQSKAYYELPDPKATTKRRLSSSTASTSLSPRGNSHGSKSSFVSTTTIKATTKSKSAAAVERREPSPPSHGESTSGLRKSRNSDASKPTSIAQTRKRAVASTSASTSSPAKKIRDGSPRTRNGGTSKSAAAEKNRIALGPLTERLVQALIEDYGNGAADEFLDDNKNGQATDTKNGASTTSSNSKVLMKTLNLGNLKALENRIRKELIDQGLLDSDDDQIESKSIADHMEVSRKNSLSSGPGRSSSIGQYEECAGDDEVAVELKRRQHELMCVQRTNHERLNEVLLKAESQVEKSKKEQQLQAANEEVLNLCARFYGVAPTSRKPSGKKERDALWKALKEREKAITKLKSCQ